MIYTRYDTKTHQYRINGIMILWSRLLTQVLLLDFFKLVATNQIESFVSAPDFDKSCWFDNKFSLGFDFPNLPYFIDGDIKLTQVIFDIIALAPFIVKRLKEKKDGENEFQTHAIMRYIARKHDLCGKVLDMFTVVQRRQI